MKTLVKVTRNYQVTIPAGIRERLGIKVGDLLSVEVDGDRIILKKVIQEIPMIRLGRELTIDDINRLIEEGLMRNVRGSD
ncbi:AbrB/MazE/SpoVT family DNA-binding domain-containing protein [Vulcanisaeta distributa]|uniref:Transcriptional regulator, AbrB family n=1 Tax=Vulcanisaeta distributa (strain DSM 14429 / JCM 11212 / NBRC 100878 / IC-017) TaxID=572478 RepID=E1QRM9_VULDI|nr:AbrB/MazE/SpoVT family DNA-binding domain-containing protein [Vulcanisaeta distributa]ADN51843.1 transcriptional regulator, AbrB family [Vulcanisaeta distributa DSM 14429]